MSTELKEKYMVDEPEFPYCAGCGHTWINKKLADAFAKTGKRPHEINMVTDIGCVGLVDKLFLTNTIHTTHGRSTAFATGVQLADSILYGNDTVHVVMIGDGGSTIGLLHLVEAAKMNANITVILHNNFVYGMTGGQHSGLTPTDFRTSTTMDGNFMPPLKLVEMLKACHAGHLSRALATDPNLDDVFLEAINYPGFSLVEVVELCTGYASKWNKMSKNDVHEILVGMDCDEMGVVQNRNDREDFSVSYKKHFPKTDKLPGVKSIEVTDNLDLKKPFSVIVAGSAGEGVQFASQMFLQAGVKNNLNVMQKNDNPVTIGTGFSMTELNFSKEEILYSGIEAADYMVITSIDGFKRLKQELAHADEHTIVVMCDSLPEPDTKAKVIRKPFRENAKNKRVCNIMALGHLFKYLPDFPVKAFETVIRDAGKNVDQTCEALNFGYHMGSDPE